MCSRLNMSKYKMHRIIQGTVQQLHPHSPSRTDYSKAQRGHYLPRCHTARNTGTGVRTQEVWSRNPSSNPRPHHTLGESMHLLHTCMQREGSTRTLKRTHMLVLNNPHPTLSAEIHPSPDRLLSPLSCHQYPWLSPVCLPFTPPSCPLT